MGDPKEENLCQRSVKVERLMNRKESKEDIFAHSTTNPSKAAHSDTDGGDGKCGVPRKKVQSQTGKQGKNLSKITVDLEFSRRQVIMMRRKVTKRLKAKKAWHRHEQASLVQHSGKTRPWRFFWLIRNPLSFPSPFFPFRFRCEDGRKIEGWPMLYICQFACARWAHQRSWPELSTLNKDEIKVSIPVYSR